MHYQSTKTFKTYQQQSTQSETPFNLVINDNFVMGEFMVFPAAACAYHNCFIAERSAYLVNYSKDDVFNSYEKENTSRWGKYTPHDKRIQLSQVVQAGTG